MVQILTLSATRLQKFPSDRCKKRVLSYLPDFVRRQRGLELNPNRMSESGVGTGRAKDRRQIGDELLRLVHQYADAYHQSEEKDRHKARERYIRALNQFNDFVLHNKQPD